MRDLLIDILDAIVFHPVFEELFNHPTCVWARSLPPWKSALFHLFLSTIGAFYYVFIIILPLQAPFWRCVAQVLFRP